MDVHVEIAAETLFNVGPIPVTNSMLTMFIVMGLILLYGWWTAKHAKEVPSHKQSIFEVVVEFLLGLVGSLCGRNSAARSFRLSARSSFYPRGQLFGTAPCVGTIGIMREEESETVQTTEDGEHSDAPAPESEESSQIGVFDIAATAAAAAQTSALAQEEDDEEEHEEAASRSAPASASVTSIRSWGRWTRTCR